MSFMETLSPEQQRMFYELSGAPASDEPPAFTAVPPSPSPPPLTRGGFYNTSRGVATDTEVLVLAVLLQIHCLSSELTIEQWLIAVESDADRIASLGAKWYPSGKGLWHPKSHILTALENMLRIEVMSSGGDGTIETVAAVVSHTIKRTIAPSEVYAYIRRLLKTACKSAKLLGPDRDGRGSCSSRQVVAIPAMASLLRSSRRQLRHAIFEHRVVKEHDVTMTKAELVDYLAEQLEAKEAEVEASKAIAAKKQKANDQLSKNLSKAKTTNQKLQSTQKGTAKRVREEERAKANKDADARVEAKVKRKQANAMVAHVEKREWKERAEKAEHLASVRHAANARLKDKNKSIRHDYERLALESAETEEGELREQHLQAWARQQAMPTWGKTRGVGKGRGQAGFDFDFRVTIYSMLANGTPLSAIGPNIKAVVSRTAPWLKPEQPSPRVLTESRFELRAIEEALAARRVAASYAIRLMGFDETTKKGNPSITSNVIIEPTMGAPLEPVILRGAYCSAGGTSELVAKAIEDKCFERLRDLLRQWKAKFLELYPDETWTGPEAEELSLARLAGGGALQSDTCNTAEKAKKLLVTMIGEQAQKKMGQEAWDALTEKEQQEATRVHELDCYQHLRNIFLKEMSAAQAKHVADELKPHLDTFSSWDRMTTEYTQLLRAAYKELHHGNVYYKGKGREFWVWLKDHYPTSFAMHFERAEGGRQDLDYDAAVPLYVMRPYIVEFLHELVFGANHSNILEDFLYTAFRSEQFIAMTRANALIDLRISRPLRWLAGNSYTLKKWSPISMARTLDIVEQLFKKASTDGSVLLDPTLNVFKEIADEQPLFREYLEHLYEEHAVTAPDRKTKHVDYKLALEELLNPADATNAASTTKTIEYLEVQCIAGLRKLHCPKLALSNKLDSLGGEQSFANSEQAHEDTIGLDATNDRLAESVFGVYDYTLRHCPGISMEAASAVAQAMRAKSFVEGGYFHSLPPHEQHALVELARTTVREMRKIDRADHAAHDAYVTAKRKSNSQLELDALIKQYALALSFFKRWQQRGVTDKSAMRQKLDAIATDQLRLDWLREQIEMRVIGLGFVEFKPAWSSSKDAQIGTVADLTSLLEEILDEERERSACRELPEVAVVPIMKRKSFKELGTPTVQAKELATTLKSFSEEEILEKAEAKRMELEAAGEIDIVGDSQQEDPPPINDALVGTELEVCWRYWRVPTEEELAKGEKRKKIGVPIWCEGTVSLIANGTTTTENPENARCKKLAAAGAVRIKWPADPARNEPEMYTWSILQEANWNKDGHLGWRFTTAELRKRAEAEEAVAEAIAATRKRQRM